MTTIDAPVTAREQTRARYPDEDGYVERDGVRVFYEVYGSGDPTILLLPTWSTRSRSSGRFHASACSSYQTFSYSTSSETRNRIAVRHFSMNGMAASA